MTFYSPELVQVVMRALCDTPFPGMAHAAALFGETSEQQNVVLHALRDLYAAGKTKNIAITKFPGEERESGFRVAGFAELKRSLQLLGCDADRIIGYPLSTSLPPCTDAEALGLVGFAKESGWASLYVVAPILHLPRVFVTVISAAKKLGVELKVYARRPDYQDWNEKVFFSQSAPKARRIDQIPMELEKMRKYFEKGDHMSPKEVLKYLDWRDNTTRTGSSRPSPDIHPRDLFVPPNPVTS